jgi:hypothetical protein
MNKERLLKLADHLENGVLGHITFDFNTINSSIDHTLIRDEDHPCGTNGCALGECPFAFPCEWIFVATDRCIIPLTKEYKFDPHEINITPKVFRAAEAFFDISMSDSVVLFMPYESFDEDDRNHLVFLGLNELDSNATKEQVADNIRKFVARNESISKL